MTFPVKILMILLFSMTFTVAGRTAYAQAIDTTSAWRVDFSIWEPGKSMRHELYLDHIKGDTIINMQTYLKIYKSGYGFFSWKNQQENFYFDYLHGFLREENRRWYTWLNGQDQLLFDFTLAPGDTIHSAFTFEIGLPITVAAVDSVLVGSVFKRRMQLNNEYGAQCIIEDIGASSGLFENMVFFEWDSHLVCFALNGQSVWGEPNATCNLGVGVAERSHDASGCRLFPNPADDFINVCFPPGSGLVNVSLFDVRGSSVFHQSGISRPSLTIPLSGLPMGLYIVVIEYERLVEKIKVTIH